MIYLAASAAIVMYGLGFSKAWQTREGLSRNRTCAWLVTIGLCAHIITTYLLLFGTASQELSLTSVINLGALVITTVVILLSYRLPIDRLLILVLPLSLAAIGLVMLVAPGQSQSTETALTTTLWMHIFFSLAAYSALLLAACQSILLAVLDRQLKSPQTPSIRWLPPLDTMEELLIAMLWIGWVLLTLSIGTGFIFLEDMFAQRVAHHTIITSASWLAYSTFLGGRYLFGWRGLTAVRWTLVAFGLLVVGYLGSKFVVEHLLA